ncbi:hypothetical protein DCAR_0521109 [Daucus carota subsp. sativus]|uniref:Uncharacterized protein n=1 Tax=Daucus carota subsp. sativus TaxID=79200 RepID=A0A161YN47_DAUCS|nr:PREDICTED: uncharacterized protein LOC108222461 [Daucus carota subsp. sativus]WOH01724.1 hypothetical protein DCAR_0521109 [Daucus carota subsp. sativus]
MPFPSKIQPVGSSSHGASAFARPAVRSRLRRLFELPFANALRAPEKAGADGGNDVSDPSSVCLGNMVRNFIEGGEKQMKCSRSKCYCFNSSDSDDEFDSHHAHACEILKELVLCSTVSESNLLADIAKIVDENKLINCANDYTRKSVTDGLIALGYDASICKSSWGKNVSFPPGEHQYVDVITKDERLIVDIDFRSEFAIARSTNKYNAILEILPEIFVGKPDRIEHIVHLVSEAAKQSLKKKGMPFPPWRRADYVKSKWLAPHTRTFPPQQPLLAPPALTLMDSTGFTTHGKGGLFGTKKATTSVLMAAVKSPASSGHSDTLFSMSEE